MAKRKQNDQAVEDPVHDQMVREHIIADTHLPPRYPGLTKFDICNFPNTVR